MRVRYSARTTIKLRPSIFWSNRPCSWSAPTSTRVWNWKASCPNRPTCQNYRASRIRPKTSFRRCLSKFMICTITSMHWPLLSRKNCWNRMCTSFKRSTKIVSTINRRWPGTRTCWKLSIWKSRSQWPKSRRSFRYGVHLGNLEVYGRKSQGFLRKNRYIVQTKSRRVSAKRWDRKNVWKAQTAGPRENSHGDD